MLLLFVYFIVERKETTCGSILQYIYKGIFLLLRGQFIVLSVCIIHYSTLSSALNSFINTV
jgi:hypothetical protein